MFSLLQEEGVNQEHLPYQSIARTIFMYCCALLAICVAAFVIVATLQSNKIIEAVSENLEEQTNSMREIRGEVEEWSKTISEFGIFVTAWGLKSADILSPTDATKIINETVDYIGSKSEKWGVMMKALNDFLLSDLE